MFSWGYIGSGSICKTTSKQILKSGKHQIVGVYSRTYSRALKFAKSLNAIAFKTVEELLDDKRIQGIYIGTPHSSHYKYAKLCLERGIPVLVEKAFTLSYEKANELIELAKKNNTYICEAMWTWFAPSSLKVKNWISEGKIGKPLLMKSNFCVPNFFRSQRVFDARYGGGSLLDLGIYPIAYAYNLFGYPDKIEAKARMKNGVDYECKITFVYNSGTTCELRSAIDKLGSCSTTIIGDKCRLIIPAPMHCSRKAFIRGNIREKYLDKYHYGLYENEFTLVAQEIEQEKKESCYIPFKSTLEIMKIIEEIKLQIGLSYDEDNCL